MSQFTPRQILRRQMVIYPFGGAIVIAGCWIYWAVAAYSSDPALADPSTITRLILAALETVAIPIGLVAMLLKTRVLLTRGQMTQATVLKFGSTTMKGGQSVTFAYVVKGQQYTVTRSARIKVLDQYTDRTVVPVIYDPAKPSRAQVFASYNIPFEVESFAEAGQKQLSYLFWGWVLIAQLMVVLLVLNRFGKPYGEMVFGPAVLGVIAFTLFEVWLVERMQGEATLASQARVKLRNRCMVLFGVVSLIWTPLAMKNTYDGQIDATQQDQQSAIDRAAMAKMNQSGAEAIQKLKAIQEKMSERQPPASRP